MAIIVCDESFVHALDCLSTEWAPILTIFDPVFQAFGVEIVAIITGKLGYGVRMLIVSETNRTLVLMRELCRIISNPAKRLQH